MGGFISRFVDKFFSKKETRILVLGLDAVGKTSILYYLKLNEHVRTTPTVGFNVETVKYKNLEFTLWDIGGGCKIRLLWRHYFAGTRGIIFIMDSSDEERLPEARDELHRLILEEELKTVPILVLANKQDLNVMSVAEMSKKLELSSFEGKELHIQGTSALTGEGIREGFEWLGQMIANQDKNK